MIPRKEKNQVIERIYKEYRTLIYWIAYQYFHEPNLSEDAVQETIVKLIKYPDKLIETTRKSKNDERNYISRVANNVAKSMYQCHKRQYDISCMLESEEAMEIPESNYCYNPEQAFIINESIRILENEIGKLDRKYRDPFLFQKADGLSIEEIADITEVSTSSVTKRIAAAKKKLKEKFWKAVNSDEK